MPIIIYSMDTRVYLEWNIWNGKGSLILQIVKKNVRDGGCYFSREFGFRFADHHKLVYFCFL